MNSDQNNQVEDTTSNVETLHESLPEQIMESDIMSDAMSDAMSIDEMTSDSDASTIIYDSEEEESEQPVEQPVELPVELPVEQPVEQPVEETHPPEELHIENKYETYECSVCYKTLNMDNNVVTKCQHHFCDKCFYRWIQTNASCPICRTPIDTNAHLTQEQLATALSVEYGVYVNTLEKSNAITKQILRLQKKYNKLNNYTNMLMNRQISLHMLNDQTEASNDGIIYARMKYLNNDINYMNNLSKRYRSSYTPGLYGSFCNAYHREKERIELIHGNGEINELSSKKIDENNENNENNELKFSFKPLLSSETPQSWIFNSPDDSTESTSAIDI